MGKQKGSTSAMVQATIALLDAMKGADPEAVAAASATHEALLDRYRAETEAIRAGIADHDSLPKT